MKKIFLFVSVLTVVSLTSCKKDFTCTCTNSSTDPNAVGNTQEITIVDAKKKDAKKRCVKTTTTDSNGYVETSDCKLN